ncbi:MAG TPA: hypothetical protein DHV62_08570 [Elusimicrobia bacterium]|nr:hypothetical protein [Elusimicrobiota bacterium]
MIEIENLSKYFGHFLALNKINLIVEKGEFLTIFGPNGAGKSTLIRILSNLLRPTEGKIKIGEDYPENDYRIGVISHSTFLYDNLTAKENLYFYGKMNDLPELKTRV